MAGIAAEFHGQDGFFWTAFRNVAHTVGTFDGPRWDLDHQQNWSDATTSMSHSLVNLLNRSGSMKWSVTRGHPNQYNSDLGLGGAKVQVGSANEIWQGNATVTAGQIATLRAAAEQRAHHGKPRPPGTPAPRPAPVSAAELGATKAALQHVFQVADQNWRSWLPLP